MQASVTSAPSTLPQEEGAPVLMGIKIRNFAPLPDLSLEVLLPRDNFYRHLDAMLNLSFVGTW